MKGKDKEEGGEGAQGAKLIKYTKDKHMNLITQLKM